jgi:hypothetical protein
MIPYIADTEAEAAPALRIELPWPDKILWPNGRTRNYGYKASCIRKHRGWGYHAALDAVRTQGAFKTASDAIPIRLVVHAKRAGPLPDADNCIAAAKSALDGIADAIGVNDRRFAAPRVEFATPRTGCFVVELG